MSRTVHFNDRTGVIGIGANTTNDGEEISFRIKNYEVTIITSDMNESIEVVIDKDEPEDEPEEGNSNTTRKGDI